VIIDWPDFLPQVDQIINSHVSRSTGVAPVDVVFAGQVNLNQGKLFPQPPYSREEPMSEYMTRIILRQNRLMEIADQNQNDTDMFHLAKNSGSPITEFPINPFVTVAYENDEHKPPTKLHNRRRGPFRILSKTTRDKGDVYNCIDLVTNKEHSFHVKLLHPFQYDVLRTNIEEVATTERQYFTVERVVSHRWKDPQLATTVKGQTASNLELEIKWVGYEVPEWNRYDEPSIKKVQEVITYLESNALRHLVPQNLRTSTGKRASAQPSGRGRYKRRRS